MSFNLLLILLFSVVYAKAQDNGICECNTEQDAKGNEDLWNLLDKLEKLASEVPEEQKKDFAVVPGSLFELGCNCEEKMRKKRKADAFKHTEEVADEKTEDVVDEVREKRHVIHPKFFPYPIDLRCPKGTYWISQARTCVPKQQFDENDSEEQ